MHAAEIACALAHPYYAVADHCCRATAASLLELFPVWETRNGSRSPS